MFFSGEGFFFFLLLFPTDEQTLCVDFLIGSGVSSPPPLPSLIPVCQNMYFLAAEMEETSGSDSGWLISVFGGLRCQGRLPGPQALSELRGVSASYLWVGRQLQCTGENNNGS